MGKGTRVIIGILVIVIGVSMIFNKMPFAGGKMHESDSISLSGIDKIIVKGSSEEIRIMKSSENDLKAELSGKTGGLTLIKPKLEIKKSGSTLYVEVKRSGFQIFTFSNLELDVYISDDYYGDLTLDISSGDLEVDDRFEVQKLDIHISSGDMTIEEIHSEKTKINISSGSLTIKDFTGDLDGDISSGDVVIEYTEFDNDIKFDASSGSVEIILPEGADFDFYAYRSSGSIKTEFELSDYSKSDDKIEGIAGNGGNKINLNISSGSIKINQK